MKYKIGDKVIINGKLYKSSNALLSVSSVKNKVTYITRVVNGAKHPYNTTGDLGWMNESDIKLFEEPKPDDKYTCEIELIDDDNLIEYLKENSGKVVIMKQEDLERIFKL